MSHFFIFPKPPPFDLTMVREMLTNHISLEHFSRTARPKGGGLGKMKKCDISGPNLPPGTTPKRGGSCDQFCTLLVTYIRKKYFQPHTVFVSSMLKRNFCVKSSRVHPICPVLYSRAKNAMRPPGMLRSGSLGRSGEGSGTRYEAPAHFQRSCLCVQVCSGLLSWTQHAPSQMEWSWTLDNVRLGRSAARR